MSSFIGRRVGQYQIVSVLGEGGMAVVFRARQLNIERDVALKVIKTGVQQAEEFLRRFEREVKLIASLTHPHIVKLFDFGQHEDLIYLVMELYQTSLARRLRDGPLSAQTASRILDQIASALDYAHQKGVIHRDLKPHNILLDESGNGYLTDFGIAKLVHDSTVMTQTGLALGTPQYMSPELWQGAQIDMRADIYALGVVLFEMLSGKVPFNAATPASLMYLHLESPPPTLRNFRTDLPRGVQDVINRALAKDPHDRFQSSLDMSEAFKIVLRGEPLPDRLTGAFRTFQTPRSRPDLGRSMELPSYQPRRAGGRGVERIVIGVMGVVIVAILAVVIVLLVQRTAPATPTPSATSVAAADTPGTPTIAPTDTAVTEVAPPTATGAPLVQVDTPTETPPPSATFTASPTPTASQTPTVAPTDTAVTEVTPPTATGAPLVQVDTPTETPPPSATFTASPTPTASQTPTVAPTDTAVTEVAPPTATGAPLIQVDVPTNTPTPSQTPAPSDTHTSTPTATQDLRTFAAQTAIAGETATALAIIATQAMISAQQTVQAIIDQTATANAIASFTKTPTDTPAATATFTPSATPTFTATATASFTPTATATATPTATFTPTATPTPTFTATATATPTPTPTFTATPVPGITRLDAHGIEQVWVAPGCFLMGSDPARDPEVVGDNVDELPQHEVCITRGFWLDKYEVTNEAYQKFRDAGGYTTRRYWSNAGWAWLQNHPTKGPLDFDVSTEPRQPRVGISWYEAEAYARWRGGRLATEAEWEYAARGPDSPIYPWGDEVDYNRLNVENRLGKTAVVGSYPGNVSWCGAFDMAGNIWEWVNDWYDGAYYQRRVRNNPRGPASSEFRIQRSGSWDQPARNSRAADRSWIHPFQQFSNLGTRIVTDGSPPR